ncbi:hypothetical protein CEXT_617511 [Caerostris extrusa]|uniref:Uncharacterized protein n=1 Tax=Caerostris extrusa TaxID=172846 RepID=A0AAV4MH90_CAEEX|nr:hypothetical protein CEXT_617511 [Caerostris extrusa]
MEASHSSKVMEESACTPSCMLINVCLQYVGITVHPAECDQNAVRVDSSNTDIQTSGNEKRKRGSWKREKAPADCISSKGGKLLDRLIGADSRLQLHKGELQKSLSRQASTRAGYQRFSRGRINKEERKQKKHSFHTCNVNHVSVSMETARLLLFPVCRRVCLSAGPASEFEPQKRKRKTDL